VLRNNAEAAVADAGTASVWLIRDVTAGPRADVLASGLDGIGEIRPARDGTGLFAAAAGLLRIDLASGAVRRLDTGAAPLTALTPLRHADTFLISASPRQPAWVFYDDGGAGRAVFVPAIAGEREVPARGGRR
jgi:hypothetical protein